MTSLYRIGEGHVPRLPALMRHSLSFAFGRRERLQRRPPLTLYISSICFQRSSCYAYNHGSRYTIRVFANKHWMKRNGMWRSINRKKKTKKKRKKNIFDSRQSYISFSCLLNCFFFLNYISLLWFVMSTTFANYTIFSFLPSNLFFGGFFFMDINFSFKVNHLLNVIVARRWWHLTIMVTGLEGARHHMWHATGFIRYYFVNVSQFTQNIKQRENKKELIR